MKVKYSKRIVMIILLLPLLMGCSIADVARTTHIPIPVVEDAEETAMQYAVPPNQPHVFVNQVGYETKSIKIVVFSGKEISDSFEVIDAVSGETVYTGEIEPQAYDDIAGIYTKQGAFTELDKTGTYYIQTPMIGQSYPFTIGDNLYDTLLPQMCKTMYTLREQTSKMDISKQCIIAENLLLSYEFYPNLFSDDYGIPESGNQIPDILDEVRYEAGHLLKMQDTKTGAVLRGTKTVQTSADYAALMANFYHFYKNYDAKFARTCLQSGARAWQYVIGNSQEEPYTDDIYYAATSLYRASGNEKYHAYIKKYHQQTQTQTQIKQIDANSRELYADMAYLMTRQKVDVAICRDLMSKWMDYVETIVAKAQNSSYLSSADEVNQILSDMLCLSIVGHVITNHEYTTVLENHLHYFLGRNAEGVSYIDGFGSRMADTSEMITKQPQLTSMLLFMLGELNNIEMEMEES